MVDSVMAWVRFEANRSMRVFVDGPDGPIDAGSTSRSADISSLARRAAEVAYGTATDVELRVERPPWLNEGMVVEIVKSAMDPAEGATHRFAQVNGFLPIGGVIVTHPEIGTGIYPPEDLLSAPASVRAAILTALSKSNGPTI